ncbi:MAG: hypothetical protein WCO48_02695 [Candidatus Taylorbacteria bacterium]
MISKDHFKNKRIAVIGIGDHGEMISDIKFLIKAGALVSVYDMRSEARLKSDIELLRSFGLASYVCGSVPADDLLDMDLIILSHEYQRNSSFLTAAEKAGKIIEYPETYFFKQAPPITIIAVMGVCGKSTVLSMLSPLLERVFVDEVQKLFVVDFPSGDGILSKLRKVKSNDAILARIDSPMIKELYDIHISPHVAVFTTDLPKEAFQDSPFEILSYQTYNNFVVASDEVIDKTHTFGIQPKAKMLRTKANIIPETWDFLGKGLHDRDNAALAVQVAKLFKLDDEVIQSVLESWKPLKGRIELVKKVKQIDFYNDTASISPASTQAAVAALCDGHCGDASSGGKNIVLIMGGADVGQDYRTLFATLPQYIHTLIVVPGSGTLKERLALRAIDQIEVKSASSIEEAVALAMESARKGDKVLFSPGFGSGGIDRTVKERGERFVKAVRALK